MCFVSSDSCKKNKSTDNRREGKGEEKKSLNQQQLLSRRPSPSTLPEPYCQSQQIWNGLPTATGKIQGRIIPKAWNFHWTMTTSQKDFSRKMFWWVEGIPFSPLITNLASFMEPKDGMWMEPLS